MYDKSRPQSIPELLRSLFFFDKLYDEYKDLLPAESYGSLGSYASYLQSDPAAPDDWIKMFEEMIHVRPSEHTIVTELQSFEVMLGLARFSYKNWGYDFPEIIQLFDDMRANPIAHEKEWQFWNESVAKTISGKLIIAIL